MPISRSDLVTIAERMAVVREAISVAYAAGNGKLLLDLSAGLVVAVDTHCGPRKRSEPMPQNVPRPGNR